MKLVFASNNHHKLVEVRSCVGEFFEVIALAEVWPNAVLSETADTFEGNALLKAQQVFDHTGIMCISDDSGLEVDALSGRPGVFSARYAGEYATDEDNRTLLLESMLNQSVRSARFKTVICYMDSNSWIFFEGVLEGEITREERGCNGFGYDSVFLPIGESRTLAELSSNEKNAISHRSIALKKFSSYLRNLR